MTTDPDARRLRSHQVIWREDILLVVAIIVAFAASATVFYVLMVDRVTVGPERFVYWWLAIGTLVFGLIMMLFLHDTSRSRRCKACGERMRRLPYAKTGSRQMLRCERCGVETPTGWREVGKSREALGRGSLHEAKKPLSRD